MTCGHEATIPKRVKAMWEYHRQGTPCQVNPTGTSNPRSEGLLSIETTRSCVKSTREVHYRVKGSHSKSKGGAIQKAGEEPRIRDREISLQQLGNPYRACGMLHNELHREMPTNRQASATP